MKGLHHPGGSQRAFLTGLAHLYNLIPYQRRAKQAGQCGVEVEGGRVPTTDWFLNRNRSAGENLTLAIRSPYGIPCPHGNTTCITPRGVGTDPT
jgi:hypothetical protein